MRERLRRRAISRVVGGALVVGAIVGAGHPAVGSGPIRERLQVDFSEVDADLSDACGVEVWSRGQGTVTWSPYPEPWAHGVVLRINVNILWTLSAGGNTYQVREARVSLIRIEGDGTSIGMDAGTDLYRSGVLKVDLTTGQTMIVRGHYRDWSRICDTLTS
jgi:hypothetical protein